MKSYIKKKMNVEIRIKQFVIITVFDHLNNNNLL